MSEMQPVMPGLPHEPKSILIKWQDEVAFTQTLPRVPRLQARPSLVVKFWAQRLCDSDNISQWCTCCAAQIAHTQHFGHRRLQGG